MIIFLFLRWSRQSKDAAKNSENETIGQTIKKNGKYYTNIGDLDDNDNWVITGKYEPTYYVQVYQLEEELYKIKIDDQPSNYVVEEWECEPGEVEMMVQMLTRLYSSTGTVQIDKSNEELLVEIEKNLF